MEYSAILSRFAAVAEQPDGGYIARCPAHADGRPSLRIWFGADRKVRVTCRAGCTADDIVRSAGLTWRDMFEVTGDPPTIESKAPDPPSSIHLAGLAGYVDRTSWDLTHDRPALAYLYRRFGIDHAMASALGVGVDRGGDPFTYRGPKFRAHPRVTVPLRDFDGIPHALQGRDISGDCPDRWVGLTNPHGHRWGLYGVFEGEQSAYIVTEGPGDALTAVSAGYSAILIRGAMLAGNATLQDNIARGARGRPLIIAADSDAAGERFFARLSAGLVERGADPRRLTLPRAGMDLSDWREDHL